LLAPFFDALGTLPTAVGGDVRWCSLTAIWGHLPASLGWVRRDHLIASGVLGGEAARHLECVLEEVIMLAMVWASCAVVMVRARGPLVSLAAGWWLDAPTLLPQGALG
jgi:hypothetical protein